MLKWVDSFEEMQNQRLTVIASIVMQLLIVQMDYVGTDVVKKRLVVGNDQQRLLPSLQIAKNRRHVGTVVDKQLTCRAKLRHSSPNDWSAHPKGVE